VKVEVSILANFSENFRPELSVDGCKVGWSGVVSWAKAGGRNIL